jgi:aminoglycoside phosphotransferase (APT) family kinase protein
MEDHLTTILKEVANRKGKLGKLKEKLGLKANEHVQYTFHELGRKEDSNVFQVKLTRQGYNFSSVTFVVKMRAPDGVSESKTRKEFNLLTQLYGSVPVPEPIYLCDDGSVVRADFMVMEYVEGLHYNDISEVPSEHLKDVLTSVMSALSDLHSWQWKAPNGTGSRHQSAESFWHDQVAMWTDNYRKAVGVSGWYFWPLLYYNRESYLFSRMQKDSKPCGTTTRIHGSLDIGNVIFDVNFKVKAIIDWKYELNGDPMADLAYFLMVCLEPSPSLAGCKLLLPGI